MANTSVNYTVNYGDSRFTEVEKQKKEKLNEVNAMYNGMINESDKYYQAQIDASKQWAETQKKNQQEQTDFAIEQINQQKEQAKQDYTKEQSGAYVDWQKQSNQYGANAEQMAAQGMVNTGYSESSQVAMYTAYQNRVATAREAINRAYLEYDNMIKEARLQNSAALAEIAYNTLLKKNELALAGFQYKNDLIIAKSDKKMAVDEMYHNRWQDVLNQINTENTLAENVRQFGIQQDLREKEYAEGVRQFNEEMKYKNAALAEEKRQFNVQQQQKQAKVVSSGGGSGRGASNSNYSKNRSKTTNQSYFKDGSKAPTSAVQYLNQLIKSGASKDKVSNEISIALREGAISKAEATTLRNQFTPRGVQY